MTKQPTNHHCHAFIWPKWFGADGGRRAERLPKALHGQKEPGAPAERRMTKEKKNKGNKK